MPWIVVPSQYNQNVAVYMYELLNEKTSNPGSGLGRFPMLEQLEIWTVEAKVDIRFISPPEEVDEKMIFAEPLGVK